MQVVYSPSIIQAFPRIGSLAGLVERKHLAFLILRRAFYKDLPPQSIPDNETASDVSAMAAYTLVVEGVQPVGLLKRGGEGYRFSTQSENAISALNLPSSSRPSSASSGAIVAAASPDGMATGAVAFQDNDEQLAYVSASDIIERPYPGSLRVTFKDIEKSYPHYRDVDGVILTADERNMFIDLRPYLNPTPATVHVHTHLGTVYNQFKSLALRHLIVVNDCHDVAGIITRHDLMMSNLVDCLRLKERAPTVTPV